MDNNIIQIDHLTKDYGSGRGVFDVNISVNKGECFGYLGPNGAGKSTTIRLLMGFSKPDKGVTKINGLNTFKYREKVMRNVSYIPGEVALPLALKGSEVIEVQKELKHVVDDTFLNFLISEFQLDTSLYCKEMSLGMKRKMAIVSAMMSDPDVIILDEPSSGLDPTMQDKFVDLIKLEKKRGKTILLSSHIFREIDVSCDRIAVIKDGHIVSLFNADDLKHKTLKTYKLVLKNPKDLDKLKAISDDTFKVLDTKDEVTTICCDDSKINHLISDLCKFDIIDFKEKKETLEDYFMSFYKENREYSNL